MGTTTFESESTNTLATLNVDSTWHNAGHVATLAASHFHSHLQYFTLSLRISLVALFLVEVWLLSLPLGVSDFYVSQNLVDLEMAQNEPLQ